MEYMFTPVRAKIQAFNSYSTAAPTKNAKTIGCTPVRRASSKCRCEMLRRLEQDLYVDIPVYSSPRLEIVRKRVLANNCKAAKRKAKMTSAQKTGAILKQKTVTLRQKDRLLVQRYEELRKKMVAILDSSMSSPVRVPRKKSVVVTAV